MHLILYNDKLWQDHNYSRGVISHIIFRQSVAYK